MPFVPAQTWRLRIEWMDNEGQIGTTSYHLPLNWSTAQLLSEASTLITLIDAISTAQVAGYTFTKEWRQTDDLAIGLDSDVTRFLALYYRNGSKSDVYFLPSGRLDILDTAGDLVGIRVRYSDPGVAGLVDDFTFAISDTVTPDGLPWPAPYIVGGLAQ